MVTLETERLTLRNWQETDASSYMLLSQDVGYNCFSLPGQFLARTPEEAREKIQKRMELFNRLKLGKFPVFLKSTGEFIGTCGMEPFELDPSFLRVNGRSEVELGYRLCLKHWGNGYAQEAAGAILRYGFGPLNCARIMAFVLPQNRASVKILEKLGFNYLQEFLHYDLPHRLYEMPRDRFNP